MPKLDYRNLPLNEQLFLLQAALDHPCATIRHRAQAVSQLLQGGEPAEVARQLHFSPRVVDFWLQRFYADGIAGLTDPPFAGFPEGVEADYRQQLDVLLKADPLDYGYSARAGWDEARLSDELACETGILLSAAALRRQLKAWDYTYNKRTIDRRPDRIKQIDRLWLRGTSAAFKRESRGDWRVTLKCWRKPRNPRKPRQTRNYAAERAAIMEQLEPVIPAIMQWINQLHDQLFGAAPDEAPADPSDSPA